MATLSTIAHFYRVGCKNVYYGGLGFDNVPCVARYSFTTDSLGASSLSFATSRMDPDYGNGHNNPETRRYFRWIVTREDTGYESACGSAGWAAEGTYGVGLSGSRAMSLLPDTEYHLWLFPERSTYCLWWIGTCTVTTQGSYGTPSSLEVSDGFFGRPLPITLNRSLSDVVHTVTVDCAGVRTLLLEQGSQYPTLTWETDLAAYAALLPDTDRAAATVTAESFCQGQSLGTVTKTVEMRIPEGALEPTLSEGWVSLRPRNQGAAAAFSCLIAGQSRLEALFDPAKIDLTPLLGAGLASFRLEALGERAESSPYLSPVLTGPCTVRALMIDSRGQAHGLTLPVTPEPYAPPALSQIRIFRCDGQGNEDENGTAVGVCAALDFSSLAGENRCSLTAALRSPEGDFGPETALTAGAVTAIPGQSPDESCVCRVRAVDGLGRETQALRQLPTRRWAMKFRPDGQGVAFGKAPEHPRSLELPEDWEIRLGRESLWLRLHPVGSLVLADAAPAEGTWTDRGAALGTHLWQRAADSPGA